MSTLPSSSPIGGSPAPQHHPLRWLFVGLAIMFVLVGAAVILAAFLSPSGFSRGLPGPNWPFSLFWTIFWIILLFWVLSWAFRRSWWWGPGGWWYSGRYRYWDSGDSALNIARERYARGEISREQFDQISKDLANRPR